MYERILLATDGTDATTAAQSHAIELAATHGSTLHALYVVDEDIYSAYSGDEYVDAAEGPEHALEEQGLDAIQAVRDEADEEGVQVVGEVEHGTPTHAIVEYADDVDADVIVLGTKRRPAEYRAILGSVTDRVLRLTERPTVVVKTIVEE